MDNSAPTCNHVFLYLSKIAAMQFQNGKKTMNIPERFIQLLIRDSGIYATVLKAVAMVKPWAQDNKTVFFPEYTDHSLVHMSEVIASADSLISDKSWEQLTAQDAAVLIIAILLHDCALHVSEDGFYSLINGKYKSKPSRYILDEKGWDVLWTEFLTEARRFDQKKLNNLFGSSDPVTSFPEKKLDLTLRHRLLAGEFLRRHHARLAHEISISGIPGPLAPMPFSDSEFGDLLDLSGYVARSHNLPLRLAVDRIESTKRRVHLNCKVPFTMVVLRISDYLQIHSARAPGQLLHLKSLSSPVSRGEWKKHAAVREINQAHEDPESIFVDCEPESAITFVSMQRLLKDIQLELDQCWTVMGEIYGRFSPLNNLGITVRRIRSNIDDPADFQKKRTPSYIPKEIKFTTASAELMDLLVAPLYGAKPEIGIRELIQNAVDACLERDDLLDRKLIHALAPPAHDVLVTIAIDTEGIATLSIEDFGVGMTVDIIEKYFLNIGASFRSSDAWRKNHEIEGHSTIHRTGRFGIGVLAAFLLGQKICVTTRHIASDENNGLTFTCSQGSEAIEIQPCKFHHGTKIEIVISKDISQKLLEDPEIWDWYCLEKPVVERRIISGTSTRTLTQRYIVPSCDADLTSTKWRRISADGYNDVMWSYEAIDNRYYKTPVICNGIFVTHSLYRQTPNISPNLSVIKASSPAILVFDQDGRFPLNLQRDEISTSKLDFDRTLGLEISKNFSIEIIEKFKSIEAGANKELISFSLDPRILGLDSRTHSSTNLANLIILRNGILPTDFDLIKEIKPSSILIDATNISANRGAFNSILIQDFYEFYIAADPISQTKISRADFIRNSLGGFDYQRRPTGFFGALPISGRRLLMRKSDVNEIISPGNVSRSLWARTKLERDLASWGLWSVGRVPELALDVEGVCSQLEETNSFGLTLFYLDWSTTEETEQPSNIVTTFADAWKQGGRSAIFSKAP